MTIMSEAVYGVFLVGALLAAAHRRPVALGILIGLAALSRGEGLALLLFLVVPMFWRRWRELTMAFVACALVLTPWTVRNLATFEKPVLISTNANGVWAGANCERSYYGELIGAWDFFCLSERRPGEDESELSARQQTEGLEYMGENADRLPAVMTARLLRLLDMWSPGESAYVNAGEGRPVMYSRMGFWAFWLLLSCAIAGAVLVRRQRLPSLVLLAPIVLNVAVALATYGSTRLRYAAEPSFVVLAATALVALGTRAAPVWRRHDGAPHATSAVDARDATDGEKSAADAVTRP